MAALIGIEAKAKPREMSFLHSWPALLFTLIVAAAASYAFAPRSLPWFPPTRIGIDQLLLNGLASDGTQLVAVGELGHVLVARVDADGLPGAWHEATVSPARGSTLTNVLTLGDGTLIAVGHDSWIIRSTDGGATWHEAYFDGEQSVPLLGLAGPYDGTLYAFGGFGQLLASPDEGKTWKKQALDIVNEPVASPATKPQSAEDVFSTASVETHADRHLNAMVRLADRSLLLVGEGGLLLRSSDVGKTWQLLPNIYKGSFFGTLALPGGRVLIYGMRGHVFMSDDSGQTWRPSAVPAAVSLFGGAIADNGQIVLVGDSNTVLVSVDRGSSFMLAPKPAVHSHGLTGTLAAVLPLTRAQMLIAGEDGAHVRSVPANNTTGVNR